ncbi:SRC kinase signaling inhibitor 1-like isoform X2 [Fukomys damarensis]|uniref:SRC kinase signaling inhibitor 1-like isoform X2 n=1 Tax=Fukomys damarensis TaxID=885580 RepID=UPI00053F4CC1|nr:SRC kinase signaling inhibitor 1-like isoform X2 [Fukomys damarensis]
MRGRARPRVQAPDPAPWPPADELTVPRYRTEKPSKSPPPPPPRRSFPSSHGLTTTRTGEVVVTSKKDSAFIKKAESEELEVQKPQVKLRRAVSEVARPASTPPIMASAIKDEDEEDRIIAELEAALGSPASCVPRIVLTECGPSPPEAKNAASGPCPAPVPRPRSSSVPRSDRASGKSLSRATCPWAPALAGTQEPTFPKRPAQETPEGHRVQTHCTARRDSLEQTLLELEATLSKLGAAPSTAGPPSVPSTLLPRPQVAASPVPPTAMLLQSLGLQSGGCQGCRSASHLSPLPTLSGACSWTRVLGQSPWGGWEAGSPRTQPCWSAGAWCGVLSLSALYL